MDTLAQKLAERAALTAKLATLDTEIQTLYEAEHPKTPDSEFIIQARKDCERLLKTLRGKPYKLLKMLLESPLGILDYDETVDTVWDEGFASATTVRNMVNYVTRQLKHKTLKYKISAKQCGCIQLDVKITLK